jgi:uncharacterized phage protein (TIGR01671 family)
MREIKFRAWDKVKKEWDYTGCDISGYGDTFGIGTPPTIEISEFTGLKDKNGKEVWEGDLIAHEEYINQPSVVKWDEKRGGFSCWELSRKLCDGKMSEEDWNHRDFINISGNRIVIGNIYENPNLIKKLK